METGIVKLSSELLALFAGAENSNSLMPFTREIFLLDITVAGTTFCDSIEDVVTNLVPETILKMVRVPDNKHDQNAIAIYYENTRIGWVPRDLNLVISRLMDAGKAFFCRVQSVEKISNWNKIKAKIYMVE